MLKLLLLISTLFVSLETYCQKDKNDTYNIRTSLQGEWTGTFDNIDILIMKPFPIKLYFQLDKDSTYKVYSYSKGTDTIHVFQLSYKFLRKDSIYLEETKQLLPRKISEYSCPQKMFLKVRRKKQEIEMEGIWESITTTCNLSGAIRFKKKRD